jgi:ATP-dependent Clp protease ATP-binding subunit ClpA
LFKPLTEETCFKIIDKFINQLNEQLKNKNISVTIDNNLRSHLLKVGFDAQLGARPLERIINKKIKKLLAKKLITGEIKNNQDILLNYENNEIKMNILYKKDTPLMDSNIDTEEEKENILYRIFKYFK